MSLRAMSSALCSVAIEIVDPGEEHRLEDRVRRDRAGPADIDVDLQEFRVRLLRRELEGGRPPRELRGRAQPRAQREVVNLDDDAVGVEVEGPAPVGPRLGRTRPRRRCLRTPPVRFDRQSPRSQRLSVSA